MIFRRQKKIKMKYINALKEKSKMNKCAKLF